MRRAVTALAIASLVGCASPSSKSKSAAESDSEAEATAQSRQGTSTVPIIVICNQTTRDNTAPCFGGGGMAGESIKGVIESTHTQIAPKKTPPKGAAVPQHQPPKLGDTP